MAAETILPCMAGQLAAQAGDGLADHGAGIAARLDRDRRDIGLGADRCRAGRPPHMLATWARPEPGSVPGRPWHRRRGLDSGRLGLRTAHCPRVPQPVRPNPIVIAAAKSAKDRMDPVRVTENPLICRSPLRRIATARPRLRTLAPQRARRPAPHSQIGARQVLTTARDGDKGKSRRAWGQISRMAPGLAPIRGHGAVRHAAGACAAAVAARGESGACVPARLCIVSAALRQAPVAQLDRAPDYESGGQRFESFRARHSFFHEPAIFHQPAM